MLEQTIEKQLKKTIEQHGGLALKFVSPGMAGVPDRLIILPQGRYAFIEVKAPGKKPRPLQQARIEQLKAMGCTVHILDNPNNIQKIINEIRST